MMGIRTVCFVAAILMFVNHLGWLTAVPVVGALVIPYFAVIFANGGREPTGRRGFRPYEPNTPEVYRPQGNAEGDQGPHAPPQAE
jgi:hypothetical protein